MIDIQTQVNIEYKCWRPDRFSMTLDTTENDIVRIVNKGLSDSLSSAIQCDIVAYIQDYDQSMLDI